jgi:glycerophosphoryl diester phosphodiesterase
MLSFSWTKGACVTALVTILGLVLGAAAVQAQPVSSRVTDLRKTFMHGADGRVLVTAHRACWQQTSENSVDAIRQCVALGVDIVEIDVRRTADGELVLMHDETVDRMTEGHGATTELSFAEIRKLKLRDANGGDQPITKRAIPTLAEALEAARGHVLVNLDIKDPALYEPALQVAVKTGTLDQILFKSPARPQELSDSLKVAMAKTLYMPIVYERNGPLNTSVEAYKVLNPIAYELVFDTLEFMKNNASAVTQAKRRLWVNTLEPRHSAGIVDAAAVKDPAGTWGQLIGLGASVIQTDKPAELLAYLNATKKR